MNIGRFLTRQDEIHAGLVDGASVIDLAPAGVTKLFPLLDGSNPARALARLAREKKLPRLPLAKTRWLAPVERQEIWAAGVTYLRSKTARMEESNFSATAYDRVYEAPRPEIFFKALAEKVAGPGQNVGIRRDARWSVPEPELALVINSKGKIAGHTIGNDMSSRDIEGENLLYLPQAKIYRRSCALGPWIRVGAGEAEAREWRIGIEIRRGGRRVFSGETSVGKIKRRFANLARWLYASQDFPHGAILLTGTGVVPPDDFTLRARDEIAIHISGIGQLCNSVAVV